jgi:hypothetical protein
MILASNVLHNPLVGGTGQRHIDGTSSGPHKLLENAQTPTSRVHALLAFDRTQDPITTKKYNRYVRIDMLSKSTNPASSPNPIEQ